MNYMRFRLDEQEAERERTLDPSVIPGLLQLPAYAEAAARAAHRRIIGDSWDARAAAERLQRQALLSRETPLRLHALIDEAALRRTVGGPVVMSAQLDHLISSASLPNVTIQVLSFGVGAYGAHAGSVTLLSFPESDEPESAYVESLTGLATVEDEDAVRVLSAVWDDAARLALTVEESVSLLREIRDTVRKP